MDLPGRKGVIDLLQKVDFLEQLLPHLPEHSVKVLKATNRDLRQLLQAVTPSLHLTTQADISLLLRSKWPSLTTLRLVNCILPASHIALLAQAGFQQLRMLDLSHSKLQPEAIHHLAKGQWPALAILKLAGSLIREAADVPLACHYLSASSFPALTDIDLSSNSLSTAALSQLSKADWPALQQLNLSANHQKSRSGFLAQLASPPWAKLQHLDLSEDALTVEDAQALGQLTWPLVSLHLGTCRGCRRDCRPEDCMTAMAFLSVGQWPNLKSLAISHRHITSDSIAELLKGAWPALKSLHLKFAQPPSFNHLFNNPQFPAELTRAPWLALPCANGDTLEARRHVSWLGHLNAGAVVTMEFTGIHCPKVGLMVLGFEVGQSSQLHTIDASQVHLRLPRYQDVADWVKTDFPHWGGLRTLDISLNRLRAEDLRTLLSSKPCSLTTLSVLCYVTQPVAFMPANNDWPVNTKLRIVVQAWPDTLRSLSAGYWPVQNLCFFGDASLDVLQTLHSWELPALESLDLRHFGLGRHIRRSPSAHTLATCTSQEHDLRHSEVNSEFVHVLSHCKWPQLVMLYLSMNQLGPSLLVSLLDANRWCNLATVVVDEGMLSEDQLRMYYQFKKAFSCNSAQRPVDHFCDTRWPSVKIIVQ